MAAVLLAQIIWGIAGPMVKIGVSDIPPFSLLFLRCLLAALILFPFYEKIYLPREPKFLRQDKIDMFIAGFVGVFINIGAYFWGQSLTTVIDAWVIISTGTIFLTIYSYFALRERLPRMVYTGIGLSFIGTIIVIGSPIFSMGRGGLLGNLLILISALGAAYSYIIFKRLMEKFSAVTVAYYSFLISLPFAFPLFLWNFWQRPEWMATLKIGDYGIILYLVLGSSILAYVADNVGLKYLPATVAATLGYASSIISIALSIIFLREKPTAYFIFGTVIVAVGLFLAESRHPSHPIHKIIKNPMHQLQ